VHCRIFLITKKIPWHAGCLTHGFPENFMKAKLGFLCIFLVALLVPFAYAAGTDSSSSSTSSTSSSTSTGSSSSSTSSIDASALVYVSNVTLSPDVFFPYEQGTIAVTLTNAGTSAMGLSGPDIISDKVHIVKQVDWGTMTYVGAGSTVTYKFVVTVDPPDGTDYALFTVGTKTGSAIHYPLTIKVDSDPLRAVIADKPDTFSLDGTSNVTMRLINTRGGMVKNIVISTEGSGIEVTPVQAYVQSLDADNSVDIPFTLTTHQASNLTFDVSYQNGDNDHMVTVVLPIELGSDKTIAVPVLNNVELTSKGGYYDITGDITNAGISDAKGVVVTVGDPAVATGTYPEYGIGSIASDDSGSFEVTFSARNLSAVPVIISWKDSTGNNYKITKTVDLSNSAGASIESDGSSSASAVRSVAGAQGQYSSAYPGGMSRTGYSSRSSPSIFSGSGHGISSFYLPIAVGIIAVAGIVLYTKRKWILAKVKKQQ
jgi:hypothetical protein